MMKKLSATLLTAALAVYLQGCATSSSCCCGGDSTKKLNYTVVPDFFDANPGGQAIGACHGGAVVDAKGNIYISTDTDRGVLVYSSKGKFLRAFGPTRIHGFEIRKEGGEEYIYAARPTDHEVLKLKMDGTEIWKITMPEESGIYKKQKDGFHPDYKPCAVTVGPDGSIYVADGYGSNFVLKFDKNRKFVKAFGGPGAEEGKFNTCHGIGVDTRGKKPVLLVCNRNNNRVEHWDFDGNFIEVIQKDLRMPAAVQFRGPYAILPELQGRVTVLGPTGEIVAQVGDNPNEKQRANYGLAPSEWKDGICNSPHGATMDKAGNLIVSEWSKFGHLHKFAPVK